MVDKKIRIILDSKDAEKNAKDLDKAVVGVGSAADKSQFSLNKLAAAIGAAIAVDKIKDFADAFTSVQNQIRRTTDNQDQLNKSTEALLRLSNETRTGLADTTELYTSLAVSTKALGYSQEQVFGLTKTINNLFLESGKSAEESAGAIRQLGQALQSGALRGDEFNSIAEGAPGILRAIQLETGKTAGELRAFAATGGITAELLTKSLENYSDKAQEAADKTKVTFAQAMVVAKNNATVFVGTINEATGAVSSLSADIISLSESLASAENINNFIQFFNEIGLTVDSVKENLTGFENELELIGSVGSDAISFVGRAFRDIVPNIKAAIQLIVTENLAAFDQLRNGALSFFKLLSNPFDASDTIEEFKTKLEEINGVRSTSIEKIITERDAIINAAKAEIKAKTDAANAGNNSNFGNKSTGVVAETDDQKKARKAAEQARIDTVKQIESEIDAEGKRMDIADREKRSAESVTQQLSIELDKRRKISALYREQLLVDDQDYYDKQRALQNIKQQEDQANIEAKFAEDTQRREEQRRQALENDNLDAYDRLTIKQQYDQQAVLSEQIKQEQLTALENDGKQARIDIARAERDAKIGLYSNMATTGLQIINTFGSKSFQAQKNFAIAEGIVSIAAGVAKALDNPYPANLGFAASVALQGAKLISTIKSTNPSSSGGGSISIGGGSSGGSSIPTTSSSVEPAVQQKKVYDLRGVKADDKISVSALAALLEDDGAIVTLENAREDAARRNVIGVTAR